jgi:TetR/AcrR family transcriptional repressor of nem operon
MDHTKQGFELIDAYLDLEHGNDVAGGCPVAALASEVARRPRGSRGPFLHALRSHIRRMAKYVPAASDESVVRRRSRCSPGWQGR